MLRHLLQGPAPPHRPRLFVGHAPSERGALWELWSRAAASLPPPGRRAGGRENPGTTAAEAAPPPRAAGSTVANEAGPRGPPKQEAVRAVPAVRACGRGFLPLRPPPPALPRASPPAPDSALLLPCTCTCTAPGPGFGRTSQKSGSPPLGRLSVTACLQAVTSHASTGLSHASTLSG